MVSKNRMLIYKIISVISTLTSYIFTVLMLTEFATSKLSFVLYLLAGVIIDGVKWISLLAIIQQTKLKQYSQLGVYIPVFLIFATISIVASISFSIHNVQSQLFSTEYKQNATYIAQQEKVNDMKNELDKLKSERDAEFDRLNLELDGLPTSYVTAREKIEQQKTELKAKYEKQINDKTFNYNQANLELSEMDDAEIKVQTLKDTTIAGFFGTVSNVFETSIDLIVLIFAVVLGFCLDLAAIICTFFGEFQYTSKREMRKEITEIKHAREIQEYKKKIDKEKSTVKKDIGISAKQITTYHDFEEYIYNNNIDLEEYTHKNFKDIVPNRDNFNYWRKKYLAENKTEDEEDTLEVIEFKIDATKE